MKTDKTKVIFRKYKDTGDILALFPEIPADIHGIYCMSYEHIGQHGSALYIHCINITVPAKSAEYAEIKKELKTIGYKLQIIKRVPHKIHKERRAKANELIDD